MPLVPAPSSFSSSERHELDPALCGLAAARPEATFAVIARAFHANPELRAGVVALPGSEVSARARALRLLEVIERAAAPRPDAMLLSAILEPGRATADEEPVAVRWHVAALFVLRTSGHRTIEVVVDPLLYAGLTSFRVWQATHGRRRVLRLAPRVLLAERRAIEEASETRVGAGVHDVTTAPRGTGPGAHISDLASLLSRWVEEGAAPMARVSLLKQLLGPTSWDRLLAAAPALRGSTVREPPGDREQGHVPWIAE